MKLSSKHSLLLTFVFIAMASVVHRFWHFFEVSSPATRIYSDEIAESGRAVTPSESGFALVIVLIFIGILSEYMLSMLNSMELMKKTTTNFSIYNHHMQQVDSVLQNAKQAILNGKTDDFNTVFSFEGKTLRCKIAPIQTLPCIKIDGSDQLGADFFKISVWVGDNLGTIHVESTFAMAALSKSLCYQTSRPMAGGFLTWRIVNE